MIENTFSRNKHSFLPGVFKIGFLPVLIYFLFFCILTYPLILFFNTHFFTDTGDGLQNIWNIWWVNKAVTELHQSPWHTAYLHYPEGTSLLGQTLNPFNGFVGIFLLKFLTLTQTHNAIIIFSFVAGGFTAFILAYSFTKSYWSSLIAGYIFTFSQFHFAHAEGHMQLVSLEWIPLFILCWYKLLTSPGYLNAFMSAIILFAVLLCDHYYFLFCVITAIIMGIWHAFSIKDYRYFIRKKYLLNFTLFLAICLTTSGILILHLLRINTQDPLLGSHDPFAFSLDLLAPFIPGGHWRFASLTEYYWSRLPGNIHESSVYMGLSVIVLIIYTWGKRKTLPHGFPSIYFWYLVLLFFGLMALGPVLNIAGKSIYTGIMPYDILQAIFPPLKITGCPVRMTVMVMLSASVICAYGLSILFKSVKSKKEVSTIALLLIILVFDTLPRPLPQTKIRTPEYIKALKGLPEDGGVIDMVTHSPFALYFQTIHEKPLGAGYISRYPTSVYNTYNNKIELIRQVKYFTLLQEYNIRYLILPANRRENPQEPLEKIYKSSGVQLVRIID